MKLFFILLLATFTAHADKFVHVGTTVPSILALHGICSAHAEDKFLYGLIFDKWSKRHYGYDGSVASGKLLIMFRRALLETASDASGLQQGEMPSEASTRKAFRYFVSIKAIPSDYYTCRDLLKYNEDDYT